MNRNVLVVKHEHRIPVEDCDVGDIKVVGVLICSLCNGDCVTLQLGIMLPWTASCFAFALFAVTVAYLKSLNFRTNGAFNPSMAISIDWLFVW